MFYLWKLVPENLDLPCELDPDFFGVVLEGNNLILWLNKYSRRKVAFLIIILEYLILIS